jgi:hypothetical protein
MVNFECNYAKPKTIQKQLWEGDLNSHFGEKHSSNENKQLNLVLMIAKGFFMI